MHGQKIWIRNYEEIQGWIETTNVIQDSDGGFIFCGSKAWAYLAMHDEVWIIKTDSNGNQVWIKSFNIFHNSNIELAADGGFVISMRGELDYLTKINQNGNVEWQRPFYITIDWIESVNTGGFVLLGRDETNNTMLIKSDENGNLLWERSFDIGYKFRPHMDETHDNGFVICGSLSTRSRID